MPSEKREYALDRLLSDCREPSASVQHLPGPLSDRLDRLIALVRTEGKIPRWELAAALILDAPADAGQLSDLIRRYRESSVRQALVGDSPPHGKVLVLDSHRPGQRTSSPS